MLSRIIRLTHVGLYHNGTPAPLQLRKATLIYGENGRGKSTLAAVLDSCGRNRPELILCRSTIDQAGAAPAVELIFDSGVQNVTFRNGAWSSQRDDIRVFDSRFVHDNVHTGMAVTTENRRGLYEFALGDAARDVEQMDRLAREHQAAVRLRGERQRAVSAHAEPFSLRDFVALERPGEARAQNLRVLTEEYYKLRYPDQITETMTLENMIAEIRRAPAGSLLASMQGLVDHLDNFNEYASRYHHSNPNHGTELLREHELRHYVRGALSLIQDDGQSCPIIP